MATWTGYGPDAFDNPLTYRIVVDGVVSPGLSGRLQGMRISPAAPGDSPRTVLEGELADQGALAGVLNYLYQLQMTLVTVQVVLPDEGPTTATA